MEKRRSKWLLWTAAILLAFLIFFTPASPALALELILLSLALEKLFVDKPLRWLINRKFMGMVNLVFFLSMALPFSGLLLAAYVLWSFQLLRSMREASSPGQKKILGVILAIAVLLTTLNLYLYLRVRPMDELLELDRADKVEATLMLNRAEESSDGSIWYKDEVFELEAEQGSRDYEELKAAFHQIEARKRYRMPFETVYVYLSGRSNLSVTLESGGVRRDIIFIEGNKGMEETDTPKRYRIKGDANRAFELVQEVLMEYGVKRGEGSEGGESIAEPLPVPSVAPLEFSSFDELEAAVKRAAAGTGEGALSDLAYYYVPTVPGIALDSILLKERYLCAYYRIREMAEADPADPDGAEIARISGTVKLEWIRNADGNALLANTKDMLGLKGLQDGVYYYDITYPTQPDVVSSKSLFWVHDGYMFNLDIPVEMYEALIAEHGTVGALTILDKMVIFE